MTIANELQHLLAEDAARPALTRKQRAVIRKAAAALSERVYLAEAQPPEKGETMTTTTVYVVVEQEASTGTAGELAGVYTTEAIAEAAAERLRADWRRGGYALYEDLVAAGLDGSDWDRAVVVLPHELQGVVS